MTLSYACPRCHTTMHVHERSCRWSGRKITDIEKCYIDILSELSARPRSRFDLLQDIPAETWTPLHQDVFERLEREGRIEEIGEVDQEGGSWPVYRLLTADEWREQKQVPDDDDLRTIYEHGAVSGCRDNSVYSLICYYEDVGFTWEQTKELIHDWADRTGLDGWDDRPLEDHLEIKKQVHEEGYHWGDRAQEAANVIRRSME